MAAVDQYGIANQISYISTGGGAFFRILRRQKTSGCSDIRKARKEVNKMGMLRRTKIIATLGPSTDRHGILEKLIVAGTDAVRLNFSHGTTDDHKQRCFSGT